MQEQGRILAAGIGDDPRIAVLLAILRAHDLADGAQPRGGVIYVYLRQQDQGILNLALAECAI